MRLGSTLLSVFRRCEMAQLKISGLDDVILSMKEIAQIPQPIQDKMLNAGADALIPRQKSLAWQMGVRDTGRTADSIRKTRVRQGKYGDRVVQVYSQGTRRRSGVTVRNAEIQFLNEYGTKHQAARPFSAEANKQAASVVLEAESAVYDRWLENT